MFEKLYQHEFLRMLGLMKKRRWIYGSSVVGCGAIFAGHKVLMGFVNKNLINAVVTGQRSLLIFTCYLALVGVVLSCVIFPMVMYVSRSSVRRIMFDIRMDLFSHIEKLPMAYFDSHHSGDLLSRITNDLNVIDEAYREYIWWLLRDVLYGMGAAVVMFSLDWRLALLTVVSGILSAGVNTVFAVPLRRIGDRIQDLLGSSTQYFSDVIQGIRIIKMFNIGNIIMGRYMGENGKIAEESMHRVGKDSQINSVNFLLAAFNLVGVLSVGVFMVSSGATDLGTVMAILTLQSGITFMFLQVGGFFAQIQRALAGARRIFELLDEAEEPIRLKSDTGEKCDGKTDREDTVVLEDIAFNYYGRERVLDGLSITAGKDRVTALVGPSGGGKSTVIKLLMGYYLPQKGRVLINGRTMDSYTLQELRGMMAYVPQEAHLFDGTIEENIRYGRLSATQDEVITAAAAVYAHDFIMKMPEGYQTKVGERGSLLSGGQRQRIAIARALLKNAPILLLDEATSALDSESEHLVQQAVGILMKGRTVIVIAHRLSTIEHADRIYVIENGRVAEQGMHRELLDRVGIYHRLYSLQFRLEEADCPQDAAV